MVYLIETQIIYSRIGFALENMKDKQGTFVTCYKNILERRKCFTAKEKKISMKQHFFPFLFPPALSKYRVKVIGVGLERFACKQLHFFFCRA